MKMKRITIAIAVALVALPSFADTGANVFRERDINNVAAANAVQYDMASAYALADTVVETGPLTDLVATGRVVTATAVVHFVHKGSVVPGGSIRLAMYPPWLGTNETVITRQQPKEQRTLRDLGPMLGSLLFLRTSKHRSADYVGDSLQAKFIFDAGVLHYSRFSSASHFHLEPQTPERIAIPQGSPYDLEGLRRDLLASIEYLNAFQALRDTDDPLALRRFAEDPLMRQRPGLTSWIAEQARALMFKKGMVVGGAQGGGGE